jgi:hypothetical protein
VYNTHILDDNIIPKTRARQKCRAPRFVVVVVVVESELENHGWRMVESESFLDSTRRMVESWVFAKRGIVRLAAEGRLWRG